ncbi:MAG: hypothetical protein P1V20_10400, partial [Verrucomicrobiales bacterium]|nr:hypothetical protein [Verrucomicrobiales bacterium]
NNTMKILRKNYLNYSDTLFPTLTELCGVPKKAGNDSPSLVSLLKNPDEKWEHKSITWLAEPGSFGISARDWRYIHYANGDEELYHIASDPYEWHNLAGNSDHEKDLERMRYFAPAKFAPKVKVSIKSLPELSWQKPDGGAVPASRPDGSGFEVAFINKRKTEVEIFWMDRKGAPKSYGSIAPGKPREMSTRPGAVWMIANPDSQKVIGYFTVGDRRAKAVIPAK